LKLAEHNLIKFKCLRNEKIETIHEDELRVGDIIYILPGMVIPTDCVLLEGVGVKIITELNQFYNVKKEPFDKCIEIRKQTLATFF
jgi:intein/homing endonuclease